MNRTVFSLYLGHLSINLRAVSTNRYSDLQVLQQSHQLFQSILATFAALSE
jgi:hypothetical protein